MNMSLGGSLSQAVNRAIQALSASGIVPVVAAGNENVSSQPPTRSLSTIVLNSLQIHSANSKMRPTPRLPPPPPPLPLAPLMPRTIPRPASQTLARALTFSHPESGSSVLASSRTRTRTPSAELAWVSITLCKPDSSQCQKIVAKAVGSFSPCRGSRRVSHLTSRTQLAPTSRCPHEELGRPDWRQSSTQCPGNHEPHC